MNQDEVAQKVEAFIRTRFQIGEDDRQFSRQSNLWEGGFVDSIGVVELIAHIESTFGITLPDDSLFDPAFSRIDGIADIVCGLCAAQRVA